jgi:hypothetical protein
MENKMHSPRGSNDRRHFVGGSDALDLGRDEKALIRLGQEKRFAVGLASAIAGSSGASGCARSLLATGFLREPYAARPEAVMGLKPLDRGN